MANMYLCQTEKARLPHGLGGMVARILVIIVLNNGRELLEGVMEVLLEKDGMLFEDGSMAHH